MNTDFSDLSLLQLSDSFFPTGLYTMSNGLETVFSEKKMADILLEGVLLAKKKAEKLNKLISNQNTEGEN